MLRFNNQGTVITYSSENRKIVFEQEGKEIAFSEGQAVGAIVILRSILEQVNKNMTAHE